MDCVESRTSFVPPAFAIGSLNGDTAVPFDGRDMLCNWLLRPAVGDVGKAGGAVAADCDPRDRFVEERSILRKGDREWCRSGPRMACCCCCCAFESREDAVEDASLTPRTEDETDAACDELVIGLVSSLGLGGVGISGRLEVVAGSPIEVFGRPAAVAVDVCVVVDVAVLEVKASLPADAAAAAAAAAVFLCRRKREKRSMAHVLNSRRQDRSDRDEKPGPSATGYVAFVCFYFYFSLFYSSLLFPVFCVCVCVCVLCVTKKESDCIQKDT